jgi:hypothetical protein
MSDKEQILLVLPEAQSCDCALCRQGRWIKHLRSLLPDKKSQELCDWYNALLDHEEDRAMNLYHYSEVLRGITARLEQLAA